MAQIRSTKIGGLTVNLNITKDEDYEVELLHNGKMLELFEHIDKEIADQDFNTIRDVLNHAFKVWVDK